jgi:hypothetical protein
MILTGPKKNLGFLKHSTRSFQHLIIHKWMPIHPLHPNVNSSRYKFNPLLPLIYFTQQDKFRMMKDDAIY